MEANAFHFDVACGRCCILVSNLDYYVILYTLEVSESGDNFYVPFLPLTGDEVLALPEVDDGSYPITLPEPLPLGTIHDATTYTTAYVS